MSIQLSLAYQPPFDWELLLAFYRSHQITGVETVSDTTYERVFRMGNKIGFVQVSHDRNKQQITLQVVANNASNIFLATQTIRQMFDLDSDPLLIASSFQPHKFLDSLWKKYPGLRIARGWDPFETAICTILGQLVSVNQARQLVHQLVSSYGDKLSHPLNRNACYLFPTPTTLAKSDLAEVKTTQVRKDAIRKFSHLVVRGELDLLKPKNTEGTKRLLLSIPGIGPWSAETISLRALGDTDAFPSSDLILKRAIEKHPDIDLEQVRPWRSYVAIYLWRHYAELLSKKKGVKDHGLL